MRYRRGKRDRHRERPYARIRQRAKRAGRGFELVAVVSGALLEVGQHPLRGIAHLPVEIISCIGRSKGKGEVSDWDGSLETDRDDNILLKRDAGRAPGQKHGLL